MTKVDALHSKTPFPSQPNSPVIHLTANINLAGMDPTTTSVYLSPRKTKHTLIV